jgi:LacI family transcriptional regulator
VSHSRKTITIHDVARAAGVSVSTVSRVLNDKADVAPETYRKVQEVIAELGYTSSLAARSMRSRRTGVIGLIMPNLEDPFCVQVLKGVNHAAFHLHYDLIAYTGGAINGRPKAGRDQHYVSLLNGSLTDGVIVVTPSTADFATTAPIVAIDPFSACPQYLTVIAANHAGAREAVEHLIGLGHRRIGFIGGRPDLQSAHQRREGYEAALRAASIAPDPELIAVGDFSIESGRACARQLLSLADPPTAIFAANDQSAFGAIEAARAAGRSVPGDLSVVGFDNIPEAATYQPALTTVDQFIARMGFVAAEMLIRLVQGERLETERCEMPTQLVIRDSCRAVAVPV